MKKLLLLFALFIFGKTYSQTTSFTMDVDSGCAPVCTQFSGSAVNAVSWLWDFGDASQGSNVQYPMHCYTNPGVYTITLIVTFANGADTVYGSVFVFPNPVASFTWTNTGNNTISFTDQSIGAVSWYWYFGDMNSSTQQNPVHTYANAGLDTTLLLVCNAYGCCDSTGGFVMVAVENIYAQAVWSISPNPSSTGLFVLNSSSRDAEVLTVTNSIGQTVITTSVSGNAVLDLSNQPAGCYFVRSENGWTQKVIRQ